jgi:transcriptional regulator with XRE-family HTH domain
MGDPAEPGAGSPATGTLAERVEWLVRNRWPAGAPRPRKDQNDEIAEAIRTVTGEDISYTTVWKLRTGRADNPTLKTLGTLAKFFKVPIGYFGDGEEAESIAGQVALLTLLRDAGVTGAALHSLADLSEPSRQMIIEMIASAARMEARQRGGEK